MPFLTIASSANRGRGVFTTQFIAMSTVIEIAPVIVMNAADRIHLEKTLLYDYIFEWGEDEKSAAVGLGYISIYNHAIQPNCIYEMDFEFDTISIKTIRDIEIGDELFINYNADEDGTEPVWFDLK